MSTGGTRETERERGRDIELFGLHDTNTRYRHKASGTHFLCTKWMELRKSFEYDQFEFDAIANDGKK